MHYALGIPYVGQHGDDEQRWLDAYGALPDEPGLGMADPPRASAQPELAWALALADRVMEAAQARGVRVAVAIVDRRGDPIQQDCMDDAPTAGPFVAEAVAAAAATFQVPSAELPDGVAPLLPYRVAALPGGLPIVVDGRVVAGLGIGGAPPAVCHALATAVLAA